MNGSLARNRLWLPSGKTRAVAGMVPLASGILLWACGSASPEDQPSPDLSDDTSTLEEVLHVDSTPSDGSGDTALPDGMADAAPDLPGELGPDLPPDASNDSTPDGDVEAADGDAAASDAGDVEPDTSQPPPDVHPLYDFAGHVLLAELYESNGKLMSGGIDVRFESGPLPPNSTLMYEEGACQYLVAAAESKCSPECEPWTEYCGPDKVCHEVPHRVSAGTVSIAGTKEPFEAKPDESDWYVVTPEPSGGDLFESGKSVSVSASGADIPAFHAELSGTGSMKIPWNQPLVLQDGKDNVIEWEPQGDDATVELAILIGWHGSPPVATLWCTAKEADGKIVIPQKMVEGYPPAGGIGLFQHMSFIRRVNRKIVETQFGPVEITVSGEIWFSIEH